MGDLLLSVPLLGTRRNGLLALSGRVRGSPCPDRMLVLAVDVDPVRTMNVLDLVLVVIMVLAAVGGWRTSGALRVGRLAGLLLGALLGLLVAGLVTPPTAGPGLRLVIAIVLLLVGAAILGGVGGSVGLAVARGLRHLRLGVADRALGAVVSGLLALLGCWLLLSLAAAFWPDSALALATDTSRLMAAVNQTLPTIVVTTQ